jgi:tRNA-dihydrouridine synthase
MKIGTVRVEHPVTLAPMEEHSNPPCLAGFGRLVRAVIR